MRLYSPLRAIMRGMYWQADYNAVFERHPDDGDECVYLPPRRRWRRLQLQRRLVTVAA